MRHGVIFSLILVIILYCTGCKKDTLSVQNVTKIETGISSRINKVICTGNACVMAGGDQFTSTEVFSSQDGGMNFVHNSYPEAGKAIYGMSVAPDGTMYLSGFDGKLLISKDNGNTFNFNQVNLYRFFNGVAFTDNREAIFISTGAQAAGNVIHVDSNLNIIDTAYFKFGVNDIAMPTTQTGYIAAFGTILKTTDGGKNWAYQSVKNDNFQSVFCLNDQQVWTVGYRGSIWKTSDGGANWEQLRNGNNLVKKHYLLLDILFKDANTGWACGEKGLLMSTTDGGNSWTEYEPFTRDALRDMTLTTNGELLVVGDNGGAYRIKL